MIGLIAPAGPVKVALHPGCRIGAHLVESGVFEPETLAAWADAVVPGMTAVDVGSYTGIFAIAAAKRGAKVVAMEPMPNQRRRLRENVKLNHAEASIEIVPMAASDKPGAMKLWFNPRVPLTSAASATERAGYECHTVYAQPLDDMRLKDVAVIKIDAERHEGQVLRGAMVTVLRDLPVIIAECLGERERKDLMTKIPGSYRVAAVLDNRNLLLKPPNK